MNENATTYLALYPDGHNENVILGKVINKGGAAGKIYSVVNNNNNIVAKIFHEKKHSDTNRKKLEAMLNNRPNIPTIDFENKKYIQIAWPTALLEDKQGFCVGYLMPLIDTKEAISLDYLMQKAVRKKLGLTERYLDRVFAAYNITSVVAALHACGHYIVDLKPANVSIYKNTMLVAQFDCDGFSIRGENNDRYPAEFVSEEYIYPEGMQQSCQEMGEEQDKFALAVIIFRLLNEGIHPFSGMPRKNDNMLSIQERIANYHYAYGFWPDTYQAPHPYSIHDYLDKETMNLFERAFTKGNVRPTAIEWQTHLEHLLKNYKQCKKNHNHIYFTAKGCGLCMVAEKLKAQTENYKKQQEEPQTIRGLDIKSLTSENISNQKMAKEKIDSLMHKGIYTMLGVYICFFTFLYKIAALAKDFLQAAGIFAQLIIVIFLICGTNKFLKLLPVYLPQDKSQNIISMLKIFAYICLLIAFVSLNGLPFDLLKLPK